MSQKVKKSITLGNTIVREACKVGNVVIYCDSSEPENNMKFYMTVNDELIRTLTVTADCSHNTGYISDYLFK